MIFVGRSLEILFVPKGESAEKNMT